MHMNCADPKSVPFFPPSPILIEFLFLVPAGPQSTCILPCCFFSCAKSMSVTRSFLMFPGRSCLRRRHIIKQGVFGRTGPFVCRSVWKKSKHEIEKKKIVEKTVWRRDVVRGCLSALHVLRRRSYRPI